MDGLSLSRAEQDLIADIEYARQYASSTRADRGAWQHFIEVNETRLNLMAEARKNMQRNMQRNIPRPIPSAIDGSIESSNVVIAGARSEPEADEDDPDTAAPELCGCGRPRSHRGTCRHRIANRNGGGRKRPQQGRRRAIAARETPEAAPAVSIAPAASIAQEITLQFSVLAQRGDDRIEISGSSLDLFLKSVELIGLKK